MWSSLLRGISEENHSHGLMGKNTLVAIVVAVTALANLAFALTGVTHTVSCTVGSLVGSVYAAMGTSTP